MPERELLPANVAPRTPATLAMRLDEAAKVVHPMAPVRLVLYLLGGLMAAPVLPWRTYAAWIAAGFVLEIGCWFATLAQSRGEAIGWPTRWTFVATYAGLSLIWLILAVMLWRTGTLAGEATAAITSVTIGIVVVMLFYSTPLVFLAAGAAPTICALAFIVLDDNRGWRQMFPIWMALGICAIFTVRRAQGTPSAQESQLRLNDSLNKYKILAENVTDVIARSDLTGVYQYVSPAARTVLGYSPDELLGRRRTDIVEPESQTIAVEAFLRMMADPTRTEVVTVRVRHKDGHWLWLQSSAKLVLEDGVPVGVIDVSRDVTERVAAKSTLREAKFDAEAATLAKAEFLANVSHEIRTPMNAILGAMHLIERETISPEGQELMRQAGDSGRMLSQLLNDILDFSKIEAGQLDLAAEPMDVGEALASVTGLLGGQARAKGVELRSEIEGADLWIECDPVRLRQAMFNLVGNAVKFTAAGSVVARVTVAPIDERLCHVRLEVKDSGIGMTPEAQSHLFERFRQAEGDTARQHGGTGLGLSITRALAEKMGGELTFFSTYGQGSTFWLDFDAPVASPVSVEPVEEGLLDGVNILLVEDNPTNRLVARTMLTRLGANVDEAEDGVEGVQAARRGGHDLILMDVQMPHMDGVDATRAIRGLVGAASQVPIIGLTANAMVHQRAQYVAAGMNGVVAKPISPTALVTEIARLLAPAEAQLTG